MYRIYKCIILILLILFLAFYYRQIKLNQHIERANEARKVKETFDDSSDFSNDLPKNPNMIFESITGTIHIFKNHKYWRIMDNKIVVSNEYINKYWNINNSFVIDSGYYDFPNLNLVILSKNKIYTYNLINNKLSQGTFIKDFYPGLKTVSDKIINLFCYRGLLYFFGKNNIFTYDSKTDTIISENNIKNIPDNFSCAFVKFTHIDYKIPGGRLYFVKGHKYYICDSNNICSKNGINFKLGFLKTSNKFEIDFKPVKIDFVCPKKGKYRIFTIGAGNKSGGHGGILYNDYILKKDDRLEMIVGESGDRLPVKHKEVSGLEKNYNNLLPYTGSSSGSGGTYVFKNNKLLQASGGGGGWSSEIIRAPNLCNSVPFCVKNNGINTNTPQVIVPIKKLIIETMNSSKSKHRILVTRFDVNINNYESINIDVIENPPKDILKLKDSKLLYETSYSNIGENASLEFTFDNIITDYEIKLDYKTLSTKETPYVNTKLILIDEQYRRLEMTNYHNFYKVINSQNIINYFTKNKKLYQITQKFIEDGNQSSSSLFDVTKNQAYFSKLNPNNQPNMNNFILLKGGIGGGGHSISDRNTNRVYCGGGGGYIGGKSCIPNHNLNYNFDYVAACGGSSFIKRLNFKSDYIKYLDNYFINDYNHNHGSVIIYEILDIQKTSIIEDSLSNKRNQEIEKLVGANKNTTNFFNKNPVKNRNKYQDIFRDNTTRPNKNNDFKNVYLDTHNFNVTKKSLQLNKNSKINFIRTKLKQNSMKNVKILITSNQDCQFKCILLNLDKAVRYIIKNNLSKQSNLLEMNHGLKDPSRKDILNFHELLCKNEIYKFMNYIEVKDLVNQTYQDNEVINIFTLSNDTYNLKANKKLIVDVKLIDEHDYIYLLFKKPYKKTKVECVYIQYNSESDTSKDLNNQIVLL